MARVVGLKWICWTWRLRVRHIDRSGPGYFGPNVCASILLEAFHTCFNCLDCLRGRFTDFPELSNINSRWTPRG